MCTQFAVSAERTPRTSSRLDLPVMPRRFARRPLRRERPVLAGAFTRPKRAAPEPDYRTNQDVAALVRAFEDATLPRAEWDHEAHLLVALVFARRSRPGTALARLREGISRYNSATGTPSMPTRGYHETVTRAWLHLVLHFLDTFDDGRPIAALADLLVERFPSKDALFAHYSRERLLSSEARAGWVEPDLLPLPTLAPWAREDRAWLEALDARAGALPARAAVEAARAVA